MPDMINSTTGGARVPMRVLFASSEIHPLSKTGGLADVSEALPAALSNLGVDVQLITPGYPSAFEQAEDKRVAVILDNVLGFEDVRIVRARTPKTGVPVWLVDCPDLYDRDGGPYQDRWGDEWPDNAQRFAMLNHVAAKLSLGATPISWRPDVVHANDWHTGLLPALLAAVEGARPATVFTIHNMAYQGVFPADLLGCIGFDNRLFGPDGFEFYGKISFLKSGICFSDYITTVSPTYAKEIMTPEYGHGLDGLLRQRAQITSGILNGVDYGIWDPRHDPFLAEHYSPEDMSGKLTCKKRLQESYGLDVDPDRPIVAFMSRLTHQKMADCVLEALPWIAEQDVQFVLVGQGDSALEEGFRDAAARLPRVAVQIGYDEPSAHRLLAGADILLAPSRFEPCGLTHLYAMRYGTVPIVRRTGGLADTVVEELTSAVPDPSATGYVFQESTTGDMVATLEAALDAFRYPLSWRRLMLNSMSADFSWEASARRYLALYHQLTGEATVDLDVAEVATVREAV